MKKKFLIIIICMIFFDIWFFGGTEDEWKRIYFIAIFLTVNWIVFVGLIDMLIISPTLKTHGKKTYTWNYAKHYPKMFNDYKEICIKENSSLIFYYMLKITTYFACISALIAALYGFIFVFLLKIF